MLKIAIDGPAGCGKSSLGRRLSALLEIIFLDAGILYRTVARLALNRGISANDVEAVTEIAAKMKLTGTMPPFRLRINKKKIRRDLNTDDVNVVVPIIAAHPSIREQIRRIQQRVAAQQPVIFTGRDIGTVVLPDADLKFYLDVSLDERARRRYRQYEGLVSMEYVRETLEWRDFMDSTRTNSPMRPAEDAIIIRSDDLSRWELRDTVMEYIKQVTP